MTVQFPQVAVPGSSLYQPELVPGERIVWAGQPNRPVLFHQEDAILIPVSLLWGGFLLSGKQASLESS
jgi:hypothetical protein